MKFGEPLTTVFEGKPCLIRVGEGGGGKGEGGKGGVPDDSVTVSQTGLNVN